MTDRATDPIDRFEEVVEQMTEGPWEAGYTDDAMPEIDTADERLGLVWDKDNLEGIILLRNCAPEIVRLVRAKPPRLREETLEAIEEAIIVASGGGEVAAYTVNYLREVETRHDAVVAALERELGLE
jgi:hypothetical protein